ncbi:MAG: 30S ribosomal protein S18 [Mariprofundaceae bacterium]
MTEETVVKTTATPTPTEREAPPRREAPRRDAAGGQRQEANQRRRFQRRRKFCKFCADTSLKIDHKDPDMLGRLVTERYKIIPARVTGTCAKHQRALTGAIKRARNLALLPFTPLHHD